MKLKPVLLASAAAGVFALASCGKKTEKTTTVAPATETTTKAAERQTVMSYAEYMAAEDGTEVTIGAYVAGRSTWNEGTASFYLQNVSFASDDDEEGTMEGYYVYGLACTEEEYDTLVRGTYMEITGARASWKGQAEINYSTATDNQGWYLCDPTEVRVATYYPVNVADISTASLDAYKNCKIDCYDLKVTADAMYSWDGSGAVGDDIYFSVSDGTNELSFVVESSLEGCGADSEVYKAASALKAGDIIDLEGFVYYYNVPQVQVTAVTKAENTYADYVAAADDSEVTISGYIQDRCTWYNNAASFYLADNDGGYYVYNLSCTEDEYKDVLVPGQYITITGAKSSWHGETEINYGTLTDNQSWETDENDAKKVYAAAEVADIATETLDIYKNRKVSVKNLTVVSASTFNSDDNAAASGVDIYVVVSDGTNELTFCVEAYLEDTQFGSETYTTVGSLQAGDKINLEGFIYYWNNPQMQITSCTKVTE